jgi:glucose/mannose-6-phosphate isomerase
LTAAQLHELAWATPDQMLRGAEAVQSFADDLAPLDIANIVVLAMGSARTAGNAVAAVAGPELHVPVVVESSYRAPSWVDRRSLVIAVSGSGNTDEVNHAAAQAYEQDARLVAVSATGWLADFADSQHFPLIVIPNEIAPARSTFGFVVASLLAVVERTGLLPGATSAIGAAAAHLRSVRDALAERASSLAPRLRDKHVTFQGDTPLGAAAAERWKAQCNQNARQPGSASRQPDAGHNEVVAWDAPGEGQRGTEAVVLLRHPFEDPRVARRIDQFAAYMAGKATLEQVRAGGGTPLSALMELAMLGDLTSLALAGLRGVDPSSIPFISKSLKEGIVAPTVAKPPRTGKNDVQT